MLTIEMLTKGITLMESELKLSRDQSPITGNDARLENWLRLLEGWTDQEFWETAVRATMTLTWFPSIGELAKLRDGDHAEDGVLAWQMVLELASKLGSYASITAADMGGDEAALWCVSKIGWQEICHCESEKLGFLAAEFRKLYGAARSKGLTAKAIGGIHEIANGSIGFDTTQKELCGRVEAGSVPELPDVFMPSKRNPELTEGAKAIMDEILEQRN